MNPNAQDQQLALIPVDGVNNAASEEELPRTPQEWLNVAREYEEKWNFPHCLGSIDGKHIPIKSPPNSGSDYFNYKGFFSIVLLGLVDANHCFLYANVGCQGRISDGGVYANTQLCELLQDHQLGIPEPRPLPQRERDTPFVIVADDAFPLGINMMKPFKSSQELGSPRRIFNYRLSRARRVVENAFGILSAVFRVMRTTCELLPRTAIKTTQACIVLHNFLIRSRTSSAMYCPPEFLIEIESGELVQPSTYMPLQVVGRRAPAEAQAIQQEFADYFMSPEGRIDRQIIVE